MRGCAHGTSVASPVLVRAVVAFAVLMGGCLVTDKMEFQAEPSCPPSISSKLGAEHPIESVSIVDRDADVPDAGMGELKFEVVIRDCNTRQDLQWQAFLDYRPEFGGRNVPFGGGTLAEAAVDERELTFTLPFSAFGESVGVCHKVELLVSGRFGFGPNLRDPEEEGDIDIAVWWVGVVDATVTTVDLGQCR